MKGLKIHGIESYVDLVLLMVHVAFSWCLHVVVCDWRLSDPDPDFRGAHPQLPYRLVSFASAILDPSRSATGLCDGLGRRGSLKFVIDDAPAFVKFHHAI